MAQVAITNGQYRNKPVNGTFTLVKPLHEGKLGLYVSVVNSGQFDVPIDVVKIKVNGPQDLAYIDYNPHAEVQSAPHKSVFNIPDPVVEETEEEAMTRIAGRFQVLDEMTGAVMNGNIRAMIVSGPPGIGKSYTVEQHIEAQQLVQHLSGTNEKHTVISGAISAPELYKILYAHSGDGSVLVLDDADEVFGDEDSLNLLKAALNTGKRRRISWNRENQAMRRDGIPDHFDFCGAVIFISNLKFDSVRSTKIQAHLDALQSRCHYLDLTINNQRDKILRLKQVNRDCNATGGIFADHDFTDVEADEIITFMEDNKTKLREISIRMAIKLADLKKISASNWKKLATSTCMRES